ncbi:DHHA1 domain-containing protein [Methanobrevibacter sp.]|uniref:DHHA1 domain-containing protein n=1 Tax=Methanobrevibacter sp. TaxID=66852 RepID=UPI00388D5160
MEIPELMAEQYRQAKELIEKSTDIKVYSHIDCDGICSGAILSTILDRLNKPHEIDFVNLDVLDNIDLNHELTIFSDLGSGQHIDTKATEKNNILILDHHPPLRDLNYKDDKEFTYLEINPIHHGIDGSYYVCGGGLCYFLAKEFGYTDLSWIGVLSAIGDMQNTHSGHFEGLNKIIQSDAENEGYLDLKKSDLNIYGRNTRELFIALSYFSDVKLPITNNQNESKALLDELGIDSTIKRVTPEEKDVLEKIGILCEEGRDYTLTRQDRAILNKELDSIKSAQTLPPYLSKDEFMILFQIQRRIKRKTLSDLTDGEKGKLYNALNRMIINEVPPKYYEHIPKVLIGDSYTFLLEDPSSFLRDGAEFSTAMNACGRNHEEKIAMEVLKGNRDWALVELEEISRKHRYNLATSMEKVAGGDNIIELENLQYFDGTGIKPEIVGTITGMILGYCNWRKPIIGFTQIEDSDGIKVSLRCSRFLSYDGIHFGNIIRRVAQDVGGSGGGHAMACGAYIPLSKKSEFLEKFNQALFSEIS